MYICFELCCQGEIYVKSWILMYVAEKEGNKVWGKAVLLKSTRLWHGAGAEHRLYHKHFLLRDRFLWNTMELWTKWTEWILAERSAKRRWEIARDKLQLIRFLFLWPVLSPS